MLTRLWRGILTGVAAVVVGFGVAPAQADIGGPVFCDTAPTNPACIVRVVTPGTPGGGGGTAGQCHLPNGDVAPCYIDGRGWLGNDGCYYKLLSATDLAAYPNLFPAPAPPGRWYEGWCGDPATNVTWLTRYSIFGTPPGQMSLAREAVQRLQLPSPVIRLNPAAPAPQVVRVPTWLWVAPVSWGSRSATASVPGLSVTATATPVRVVWLTGDGASVTCQGPGTAWKPGTDPAAASPTCGHTYLVASSASAGGVFTLRATVTWRITWAGGGLLGTEPDLQTTSTMALRVTESQAINTGSIG